MSLLLERLEIKHPIFLAPMAGVSTPELAAEVSNQGGLGSLGLGANTAETTRSQILKTQALTNNLFKLIFSVIKVSNLIQLSHKHGLIL